MHFNCPLCSRESKVGVAKKILVLQKFFGPLSLALKSVAVKDEKCHSQQALNGLLDHVCSQALPTRCVLCWVFALQAKCLLGVCSEGLAYLVCALKGFPTKCVL